MTRWLPATWLTALLALTSLHARALGVVHTVPTREGITTSLFWQEAKAPKATLLMFPGGGGGFGKVKAGVAGSRNFLVRAAPGPSRCGPKGPNLPWGPNARAASRRPDSARRTGGA